MRYLACLSLGCLILATSPALAKGLQFKDPKGDDKGPGTYTYPTDAAYKKGSFDLTDVELTDKGKSVEIKVSLARKIEDPWDSKKWQGNGFSVQMVQIYIDQDHKAGSGHTAALPGMNASFAADEAWDKMVFISPQPNNKISQEIDQKAAGEKADIILPTKVTVRGSSLIALVDAKQLGKLSPSWGVQALVGSNEGYPKDNDLLSRRVNEFEGPHRFGGGCDYNGDPHFVDCLASPAKGGAAEADAQYAFLKTYKCGDAPQANVPAVVPMVYGK